MGARRNIQEERYAVRLGRDAETGSVRYEFWSAFNRPKETSLGWPLWHREGFPAQIWRTPLGVVSRETWYQNGKIHREGGPADTIWDTDTGVVTCERWYLNSLLHRVDGPAVIYRNRATGKVASTRWYLNGELIPAPKPPSRSRPPLPVESPPIPEVP